MKKFLLFSLFYLLFALSSRAGDARFSLLTCSPGDEAYSLFGHTALRYVDKEKGVDIVFNYGYFSFAEPNFVWRFILGQTDYMVGTVSYDGFLVEYADRGSSVVEQVLNLAPAEEEALLALLVDNCRLANRVYRYNYFYANCTTKARDKVLEAFGGKEIVYAGEGVPVETFREALAALTNAHPWYAFGIDLLMGSDVDEKASRKALQFIPQNLMADFAGAAIQGGEGAKEPLVVETNLLLAENKPHKVRSNFTPFNASLLLLLFTLVVMLCEVRSRKTYWWYDVLLMTLQGVAGMLLLFMGLFSEHPAVDANYAVLLLNPLALLLMPVMLYRAVRHKAPALAWVQVAFVALFVASALAGLQSYPAPLYFCAAALLARSLFYIYKERICELNIV